MLRQYRMLLLVSKPTVVTQRKTRDNVYHFYMLISLLFLISFGVNVVFVVVYHSTVKPANAITSIKQPPVLRYYLFLPCYRKFHMN
jgi:hypothetical protein